MSQQIKPHRSTGMEYYYFILRTIFGMIIFFVWTRSINTFSKSGFNLFWELFALMFVSGMIARVISYLILFFVTKSGKGIIPGFMQMNFQHSINRISIVFIVGTMICCLIYAFGINQWIINFYFSDQTGLWPILISYFTIKIGSQAIAWVFLKIGL